MAARHRSGAEHAARNPVRHGWQPLHRRARQPRSQESRAGTASSRRWPAPASPASAETAARREAQLRAPHSIVVDRDGALLICDIGNPARQCRPACPGPIPDQSTPTGQRQAADTPGPRGRSLRALFRGLEEYHRDLAGRRFISWRCAEANAILRIDSATQPCTGCRSGTGYSGDAGRR